MLRQEKRAPDFNRSAWENLNYERYAIMPDSHEYCDDYKERFLVF